MVVVLDELLTPEPARLNVYWHTPGRIEPVRGALAGRITGSRAAVHFALAATLKPKMTVESHRLGAGGEDHVLRLSGDRVQRACVASIFSRERLGKVALTGEPGGDVQIGAGDVTLRFGSGRGGLELTRVDS